MHSLSFTLLFGFIALIGAALSISYYRDDKYWMSIVLGVGSIPFVFASGYSWRIALLVSGKNIAWLGFERYPFALGTLVVIFVVSSICIGKSIQKLHQGK
ncbi:MAG: hypothetical protein IJF50_03085 [Peptococcaceae bacterium]|nr:hypothetical protein [Peptococcaceae bacterium]